MSDKYLNSSIESIVFFTESSRNIGGQELQLMQQMEEFKKRNILPILICKPNTKIYNFAKSRGLELFLLSFRNNFDVVSIVKMMLYIKRLRPLAVISHSGHDAGVSAIAVKFSRYLFGIKTKLVRMKTYRSGYSSSFSIKNMFDVMFVPSNFLRAKIIDGRDFLSSKVRVLYPGIAFADLDLAAEDDIPRYLANWLETRPGPLIVHGAMLRREKGHDLIISALPSVLSLHSNVRYIVAGEGEERQRLEALVVNLKLQDHVYFAGMVTPISALLKKATVAVLPSLSEPLGMFQIESQDLCIPTIAHNIGGIIETMSDRETGLLIDVHKSHVWADNITWALENVHQMEQWAANGREFVLQRFSLNKNIEELLRVINA